LTIQDWIARFNITMPNEESYLNEITPGPIEQKVTRVTMITPSNTQFLLSRYFFSAGLPEIAMSNFSSTYPPEK